jgi:hypothetical protein
MGASVSDYGAKASRDLIVTRGAGFRKEKNKKKRGVSQPRHFKQAMTNMTQSYVGGEITLESHSIKFDD